MNDPGKGIMEVWGRGDQGLKRKEIQEYTIKEACSSQSNLAFFLIFFLKQPNAQFLLEKMRLDSMLGRRAASASVTKETDRKELEKQKY